MSIASQLTRVKDAATTIKSKAVSLGLSDGGLLDEVAADINAYSTQTKSITLSTSAQTITPDTNKLLTSVSVPAVTTYYYRNSTPASTLGVNGDICLVY